MNAERTNQSNILKAAPLMPVSCTVRRRAMVAVWALATDRQVRHDFKLRHYRLPRLRAVVSSVSTGCRQCVHYQWISVASRMAQRHPERTPFESRAIRTSGENRPTGTMHGPRTDLVALEPGALA
jgi:hypothetical protein